MAEKQNIQIAVTVDRDLLTWLRAFAAKREWSQSHALRKILTDRREAENQEQ